MKLDVRTVDIADSLQAAPGEQPVVVVAAEDKTAVWHMLHSELPQPRSEDAAWSVSRVSEFISVPLFAYRLTEPSLESLTRFGAQYGLLVEQLSRRLPALATMLLLFSHVYNRDDGGDGYQLYAGAALKEKT